MSTEGFVFAAVAQAVADSTPDGTEYEVRAFSDFERPGICVDVVVRLGHSGERMFIHRCLPLLDLVHAGDPRVAIRQFAAAITLQLRQHYQQQPAAPVQSAPPNPTTES